MQDFQRGKELVAEIGLPASDTGERGRRAHHRTLAARGGEIGFDAPDSGDDVTVDAVGLFHRVESRGMLRQYFAAARDACISDEEIKIVPERAGEFRLGVEELHDL